MTGLLPTIGFRPENSGVSTSPVKAEGGASRRGLQRSGGTGREAGGEALLPGYSPPRQNKRIGWTAGRSPASRPALLRVSSERRQAAV